MDTVGVLALWNLCSASVTLKFYKKVSLFSLVLLLAACCCCYVLELFTIWLGWILSFPKMPKPPTKCVYVSLSPYYNWLPIACGRAVVVCSLRLRVFIYILFILSFIFFFNSAFGIVISVFFSLMCVVAVVARYYEFLSTIYTHTNTLNIICRMKYNVWTLRVCVCMSPAITAYASDPPTAHQGLTQHFQPNEFPHRALFDAMSLLVFVIVPIWLNVS